MNNSSTKHKIDSVQKRLKKVKKKRIELPLRRPYEYAEFIKWIATPSVLRNPSTQGELSKEFEVSQKTLSVWKKRDGFWDEVRKEMKGYFKNKTPNVIQAVYQKILKGDASSGEAKLWMEYIDEWVPKQENINRDKTLEDLIDEAKQDKQQNTNREPALDTKQTREAAKVHAEPNTELLPEKENTEGSDIKSEAKGV